jgi:hypothetical protein
MSAVLLALLTPLVVTVELCETGSGCNQCFDTIHLTFRADPSTQRVKVTGSAEGQPEEEELLDQCRITDRVNWTCRSTVTWVQAHNGVVVLTQPEREEPPFEVCMR